MIKIRRIEPFLNLTAIQVIAAGVILGNELLAINNRVPGGNYPFEHVASWPRVLIFSGGAVINLLAAWIFILNKKSFVLPSFKFSLLLAILPTLSSVAFHYLSYMGWCCEHPWAFYFGFPFSFLLGIGGYDSALAQVYTNYGLFEVLTASKLQIHWQTNPMNIFLDILFWSNLLFVILGFASLFYQKGKPVREYADQIQSENI